MNEFKNIWTLTKSGFLPKEKQSIKQTLFLGLKLYGILILLKAICFGIFLLIDYYEIFEMPKHVTGERLRSFNPIIKIVMIAVITPIIEEFTFRIGLLFSKRNLTITVIGISYFALMNLSELERFYSILIALGIGSALYLSLNQKSVGLLLAFWKTNRRKIFYGLLLIFGLPHIANYELTSELLIFSPIVILPHLAAGIIYSYARLNSGIILAICIHSFNNGILPVTALLIE